MELNIIHDADDLRFYAVVDEEEAELTYTFTDEEAMDLDYTFVPENHRNKGLADQLVKAALDYARHQNIRVIPSCPVAEAYIKRHPGYNDIVCL
ncbi:GNAT family N-acetyltransferase [Pontibacter vulgaris]|uniref:GNAT family N-acetyltransferase n=1 Tax=Pontibacter vulgaris TaxID=2905679 RepID=UPI001FA77538|nr:GNAT family N-acetyltransferase [Pontibacter vulgaris]